MTHLNFSFYQPGQVEILKGAVLDLLEDQGVKLDPHPELFKMLVSNGIQIDRDTGLARFPKDAMKKLLASAPGTCRLGAASENRILDLPRPDGTFYTRTGTGAHGFLDPETGKYRTVQLEDLVQWARLINHLDEINFLPFLFSTDVPMEVVDIHGLGALLKNTDKHIWVQPYSLESIDYLIQLGSAAAGGTNALSTNPLISMIACSLTPRAFKHMDLEVIYRCAKSRIPIHACSLPGIGSTSPATLPGTIVLTCSEILAMVAMAQAVSPGTPVIACPIIFSADMKTGRSLQSSVESMKCAAGAVQFLKTAFNLPTHNYGSGTDSPVLDGQSVCDRTFLSTLMTLSGLDILGGAGQLEVATTVSPLQLIMDNELFGMLRKLKTDFILDDDQLATEALREIAPGNHFLGSRHTFKHCRDGYVPRHFIGSARDAWEQQGGRDMFHRIRDTYRQLMSKDNLCAADPDTAKEIDGIIQSAEKTLVKS
jgi:trimethylamine:corrinoid methyltransferase-like protein